jgi:hypothetical protein
VLRRIFEPKGEEIIGGWIKLHNDKLHNLHGVQIKEDEMSKTCSRHGLDGKCRDPTTL